MAFLEMDQIHGEYYHDIIRERDEGVAEIEQNVIAVNEILKDIAILAHDQGTQLDNIESNMSHVEADVETGLISLSKSSKYQKGSRNKMCIVFIILAIVLAILIITLVITNKKK